VPLVDSSRPAMQWNGHFRTKLSRRRKTKENEPRPVCGIVREPWFERVNTASMGHMNNVA
jgi:hypothetical protein